MLRLATPKDFKFIYKLYLQEARERHFNYDIYASRLKRFFFRYELKSIIKKRIRISNRAQANALVFTKENIPVGFTILSEDSANQCIEIWLVAIATEHRGKGLGKEMLTLTLKLFKDSKTDIYARCFNHSKAMIKILEKNNFIDDYRFSSQEMKLLLLTYK